MNKYLLITKNESQRLLAYRANIAAFSFGHIFEVTAQVIVWSVIFSKTSLINGYNYQQMMTYVIVGWFILFATSNYGFEEKVSRDIHQGTLANFLIKPFSYLKYMVAISIGRISFALVVVTFIEIFLFWFFWDKLIIVSDIKIIAILLLLMIQAFLLKLFISILIGLVSFWFIDISGVYFSVNVISKFLSGAFFPLVLLPGAFLKASLFFPFAYTFFVPIQFYLGKISLLQGFQALGVQIIWLFILYYLIKLVWYLGLKRYESVGI